MKQEQKKIDNGRKILPRILARTTAVGWVLFIIYTAVLINFTQIIQRLIEKDSQGTKTRLNRYDYIILPENGDDWETTATVLMNIPHNASIDETIAMQIDNISWGIRDSKDLDGLLAETSRKNIMCIRRIDTVVIDFFDTTEIQYPFTNTLQEQICGTVEAGSSAFFVERPIVIDSYALLNSAFNYPYDDFEYNFYLTMYVDIYSDTTLSDIENLEWMPYLGLIDPPGNRNSGWIRIDSYQFLIQDNNWNYDLQTRPLATPAEDSGDVKEYAISLKTSRPFITQQMPQVLIGIIVVLISLLYFSPDMGILFEGSIGIIFGIFGIREIIVPDNLTTQTQWDYAIFGLYVWLVITMGFCFARMILSKSTRKVDLITIDAKPDEAKIIDETAASGEQHIPKPIEIKKSPLIASKQGTAYHLPHCKWASLITLENQIEYQSSEEAQEAGLIPCRTCCPRL